MKNLKNRKKFQENERDDNEQKYLNANEFPEKEFEERREERREQREERREQREDRRGKHEKRREEKELRQSKRQCKKPDRYTDCAFLTYKETITGTDKQKWIEIINEEKKSLEENNRK